MGTARGGDHGQRHPWTPTERTDREEEILEHSRLPVGGLGPDRHDVLSGLYDDGRRRIANRKPVKPGRAGVYFLYQMLFEFDPAKSAANLRKHGIDFVRAQTLWSDPDRLEIPARSLDEPRTQILGRIGDVVWSAFITVRGERIRIISVRRARDEEEAAYYQD